MNRALWGYKIEDVNSQIELLSKQKQSLIERNEYLEEQIRILSLKLKEANNKAPDNSPRDESPDKHFEEIEKLPKTQKQSEGNDSAEFQALKEERQRLDLYRIELEFICTKLIQNSSSSGISPIEYRSLLTIMQNIKL